MYLVLSIDQRRDVEELESWNYISLNIPKHEVTRVMDYSSLLFVSDWKFIFTREIVLQKLIKILEASNLFI